SPAVLHRLWAPRPAAAAAARTHAAAAGDHHLRGWTHRARTLARGGAAGPVAAVRTLADRSLRERVPQGEWPLEDHQPALVRNLHRALQGRLEGTHGGHQCRRPGHPTSGPPLDIHL